MLHIATSGPKQEMMWPIIIPDYSSKEFDDRAHFLALSALPVLLVTRYHGALDDTFVNQDCVLTCQDH